MKRMLLEALVVATLALPAATRAGGLEDGTVAQWTCGAQSRPSLRQVSDWFGLANWDQVYDVRGRTHRALTGLR